MMRKEDAEKLVGREVNIESKNWKSYVPVFGVPGLAPLALKGEPVIAVHLGYKHYEDDEKTQKYMKRFSGYDEYVKRTAEKLKEEHDKGRTIIVYSPTENLQQTLQVTGPLENLVFVPNNGHVSIDSETLGMSKDELYAGFSKHFRQAKLWGEWNRGCVDELESDLWNYVILERDYDHIFPTDKQLKEWRCRFPVNDFLAVPENDYLIRVADGEDFRIKLRQGQKKLREQLAKEFNVKENTCFAALLNHISEKAGIDGDVGEHIPYSSIYEMKEMDRWSKFTVRKNLKKMERLGLVHIQEPDKVAKKIYKVLREAAEKQGLADGFRFRKIVIPARTMDSSGLGIDEEKLGTFSPCDVIKSISSEDLEDMENSGYKIVEKADVRSMGESEKIETVLSMYKNLGKELRKGKEREKALITQDEKTALIEDTKSKLQELPNIREAYIGGSIASHRDNEDSDIDLVLLRDSCPGAKGCLYSFKKGPMDIFCFTENEMKELKDRRTIIATSLNRLK